VFTWSTQQLAFADAEGYCRQMGGHLATYTSIDEQAEVEQYYLDKVRAGLGEQGDGGHLQARPRSLARSLLLSTAGLVPADLPPGLLDGPERHHLAGLSVDGCVQQL
jgi:hypothetical protein